MKKQEKPVLAGLYARVSGNKQKQEETIKSQIDAIQEYAKKKNYTIIKEWIFTDEAETGKSLERPGLDALRDLVREGGPDLIIIYEPDRLARKNAYQTLLMEEFEKAGIIIEFVKCKSPETPEEQLALEIFGAFAEFEREKILDRCRRGRLYKAKIGSLSVLPNAPYGYVYKREEGVASYEINEEQAKVVKEIFYLYTEKKYSLVAIGRYLDEKGIPLARLGKHWDRTTIRDILRNETYIGTAYYGKTEKYEGHLNRIVRSQGKKIIKSRHARKERHRDAWIPISVPAFISENDFQLAQEQLEKNKKFSQRNTKELSLLQGLLVCGECGCSFYKKKRSGKQKTIYSCHSMLVKHVSKCGNRSLKQEELDMVVWNEVVRLLKDPSLLEQEIARRQQEGKENGGKHLKKEKIEKELKQLLKAKDKLLDAYQEGSCLTIDELRPRMEKIRKKITELKTDLKTVNLLREQEEREIDVKATLERLDDKLTKSHDTLSVTEKQKVVRLLIEEIVIGKESIKIKHCIPSNLKMTQNSPLSGVRSIAAFAATNRFFYVCSVPSVDLRKRRVCLSIRDVLWEERA